MRKCEEGELAKEEEAELGKDEEGKLGKDEKAELWARRVSWGRVRRVTIEEE